MLTPSCLSTIRVQGVIQPDGADRAKEMAGDVLGRRQCWGGCHDDRRVPGAPAALQSLHLRPDPAAREHRQEMVTGALGSAYDRQRLDNEHRVKRTVSIRAKEN